MKMPRWSLTGNLSVSARSLVVMSNSHLNSTEAATQIFDDPVEYLARFGIEAEVETGVVAEPVMPAAA